jgi:hypothetical protein
MTHGARMSHPAFFDAVPPMVVRDPLAGFLGAADQGLIEYRYADAVKLAGHSCPTVAAAWQLTRRALAALYGDQVPVRGDIRVDLHEGRTDGTAGVTAAVAGLLTGAAGEGGFKGIAGHFDRRDLLGFGADVPGRIRFTRMDTGAAVDVEADLGRVPGDPETIPLLQHCLSGHAGAVEARRFGELWQDRVRRLLLDHGDDDTVFKVNRVA